MENYADVRNAFPREQPEIWMGSQIDSRIEHLMCLFYDRQKNSQKLPIGGDEMEDIDPGTKGEITYLEPEGFEYKIIEQYLNETTYHEPPYNDLHYNPQMLLHIFKVTCQLEKERHPNIKNMTNRKLLWHGTPIWNIIGILKHGLRPGKDNRICFGDKVTLAAFHSKPKNDLNKIQFVLMCEVALGQIDERPDKRKDEAPLPKYGCSSTYLLGRSRPSKWKKINEIRTEKGDALSGSDSQDCDYEIPWKDWIHYEKEFPNYHSEYRIYDRARTKVRYIVQYATK